MTLESARSRGGLQLQTGSLSVPEGPRMGAHWELDLGALVSPSVSCGLIPNPLAWGRLAYENQRESALKWLEGHTLLTIAN